MPVTLWTSMTVITKLNTRYICIYSIEEWMGGQRVLALKERGWRWGFLLVRVSRGRKAAVAVLLCLWCGRHAHQRTTSALGFAKRRLLSAPPAFPSLLSAHTMSPHMYRTFNSFLFKIFLYRTPSPFSIFPLPPFFQPLRRQYIKIIWETFLKKP